MLAWGSGTPSATAAVAERPRAAPPVRGAEFHALPDVEGVLDDVGVGELHTLGEPGRARGVLHVDHLPRRQRRLPLLDSLHTYGASQELVEAHHGLSPSGLAHQDHAL